MQRSATVVLVVALLAWSSGCNSQPATIEVTPETSRLTNETKSVQLNAVPRDKSGKALKVAVSFATLTPTIAMVGNDGLVKAISSGQATILVRAGKTKREVTVLVQLARSVRITPSSPFMMVGVTQGFRATVLNDKKKPLLTTSGVRWTSSDPTVASVDKHGNVKTLKDGTTTLTAFAAGISGKTVVTVKHEKYGKGGDRP